MAKSLKKYSASNSWRGSGFQTHSSDGLFHPGTADLSPGWFMQRHQVFLILLNPLPTFNITLLFRDCRMTYMHQLTFVLMMVVNLYKPLQMVNFWEIQSSASQHKHCTDMEKRQSTCCNLRRFSMRIIHMLTYGHLHTLDYKSLSIV